jgi:FtsP/CotA-like multicopper oxidase with cupredoxin domain
MPHVPRRLLAGVLAALAACSTAQVAAAAPTPPPVPPDIAVEAGHKPFLIGHAVGVQVYFCTSAPGGGWAWSAATPRAQLYDDRGAVIADHFGGPSWRARDGSTVTASRVDGVTPDPTAIPWLLLERDGDAAPGPGRLDPTTFIQRIATTGGRPPSVSACQDGGHTVTREVPYTADYVFWKERV